MITALIFVAAYLVQAVIAQSFYMGDWSDAEYVGLIIGCIFGGLLNDAFGRMK